MSRQAKDGKARNKIGNNRRSIRGTKIMYLLFREIGDAPHAILMGAYNTKTEARMDLWQYEMFTDYKYNIIDIL